MHIRRVVPGDLSVTITDSSVSAAAAVPAATAVPAAVCAAAMPTTTTTAVPATAVPAAIAPTTCVLTPWSRGWVPARRVGVLLPRGYEAPVG
ncbi:MAG: hypothetical protein JWQ60_4345 [Pseudonocardia sp.]|nr:hypothetical protein [Pseudonocardia sp.]